VGSPLTVWLGKDISGHTVIADLARMPHLLIAGTTGSGKSGCINSMLCSILLRAAPDEVRMILIDPKKVELNHYETIPHLLTPVVTNMKNAAAVLANVVREMESRYELMGLHKARNLPEMNRVRLRDARRPCPRAGRHRQLADLMMVSPAEVEDAIIRPRRSRTPSASTSARHAAAVGRRDHLSRTSAVSSQNRLARHSTRRARRALWAGRQCSTSHSAPRVCNACRAATSRGDRCSYSGAACRPSRLQRGLLQAAPDVEAEELDPDEDDLLDDAILCVAQHGQPRSRCSSAGCVWATRARATWSTCRAARRDLGYEGSSPVVYSSPTTRPSVVGRTPIEG
jgi:hypothetical protein